VDKSLQLFEINRDFVDIEHSRSK